MMRESCVKKQSPWKMVTTPPTTAHILPHSLSLSFFIHEVEIWVQSSQGFHEDYWKTHLVPGN